MNVASVPNSGAAHMPVGFPCHTEHSQTLKRALFEATKFMSQGCPNHHALPSRGRRKLEAGIGPQTSIILATKAELLPSRVNSLPIALMAEKAIQMYCGGSTTESHPTRAEAPLPITKDFSASILFGF